MRSTTLFLLLLTGLWSRFHQAIAQDRSLYLADPTIFVHQQTYYLYGTGSDRGFKVYTSKDLTQWEDRGFALTKGDAFGEKGFWAPQVLAYQGKFYMAYVADEQIAIAGSESPLGPFVQARKVALPSPVKMIDPFLLVDKGKVYLYHVRLQNGNRIFVAEMKDDLSAMVEGTARECISATQPWENTQNAAWPVTEGPTVLKHQGRYYLFYAANDFRNIDYAVGYAVSDNPLGPWKKLGDRPILSRRETGKNGSGHGDFFTDNQGKLQYVFHTHNHNEDVQGKRRTALVEAAWSQKGMTIFAETFRYLTF